MAVVLTIDQRGSRTGPDRVPEWVNNLNREFSNALRMDFARTVGDEMQALASRPYVVADVVLRGVRLEEWWVGVGIGEVEIPLGESPGMSRGAAFYCARDAVGSAKESPYGFAVRSTDGDRAQAITAVLDLLCFVARRRGANDSRRWEAVDLARGGLSPKQIGAELGISRQAASQRLQTAGWDEEQQGRWLSEWLLSPAIYSGG